MKFQTKGFAERVLRWQATHGRQHLPWQHTRDPYRVWLSEIMLQQTQVTTVLGYYARFLERFPHVQALAEAAPDEVMALWSGLGYYSRARNLHRCAQQVVAQWGGTFPCTAEELARLPGIGRSTAGAIAAFCFGQRVPILDANVRRVLTRVLGFDADLARAHNEQRLWLQAEALLPRTDLQTTMPRYTQALMDLGAGPCAPRNPACSQCPVADLCTARHEGAPERYPVKTRKLTRRAQPWWLLVLHDAAGRVWLERRPQRGIWAGLHCVPVFSSRDELFAWLQARFSAEHPLAFTARELAPFVHVLTHRDLHLHPVRVDLAQGPGCKAVPGALGAGSAGAWVGAPERAALGLPAPLRKLLAELAV